MNSLLHIFSFLKSPEDAKLLPFKTRQALDTRVNELANKLGIKHTIFLREIVEDTIAQAVSGEEIVIDPRWFSQLSEGEQEFILAHEVAHIKHRDHIYMPLVSVLAYAITAFALEILFPPLFGYFVLAQVVGLIIGLATSIFINRWREECADKAAFSICSEDAQTASWKFFEIFRNRNIELRNRPTTSFFSNLWIKIQYSPEGDDRLGITHPSLTNRIKYLKSMYANKLKVLNL